MMNDNDISIYPIDSKSGDFYPSLEKYNLKVRKRPNHAPDYTIEINTLKELHQLVKDISEDIGWYSSLAGISLDYDCGEFYLYILDRDGD